MDQTSAPTQAIGAQLRPPLNAQNIAKEKAAIDHELNTLHQAVGQAHNLAAELESRVSPVSVNLPQEDTKADVHEAVGTSRVYSSIHEASSGIHALQDRLLRVIRNLEV